MSLYFCPGLYICFPWKTEIDNGPMSLSVKLPNYLLCGISVEQCVSVGVDGSVEGGWFSGRI